MKTNNFYNLIKIAAISTYAHPTDVIKNKYPVYLMNGTQLPLLDTSSGNAVSVTKTLGRLNFQCVEGNNTPSDATLKEVSPSTSSTVYLGGNGKKIFILGSGTSSESINDVALSNRLKSDSISCSITNSAEDEVSSSLITVTNISNAQIAINEIGLCINSIHGTGGSYDSVLEQRFVLLERRVLSSPITIEPSESVTLVIKTGLEEDLEATVVTP